MELITDIETHYEITFSQDDFQDPRFANIEGLSNILMENWQFLVNYNKEILHHH